MERPCVFVFFPVDRHFPPDNPGSHRQLLMKRRQFIGSTINYVVRTAAIYEKKASALNTSLIFSFLFSFLFSRRDFLFVKVAAVRSHPLGM